MVPGLAKAWYLVRSPRREQVDDLYERVIRCAKGAALMTDTKCEIQMIKAIWNVLPNSVLEDLLEECMKRVGPPEFGPDDEAFAWEITRTVTQAQREGALQGARIPKELWNRPCLLYTSRCV